MSRLRTAAATTATGVLIASGGLLVGAAPTALAHAALESSTPPDGSSIRTLPDAVSLTFDEDVVAPAFVNVVAPDGSDVATGNPAILDNKVTQRVDPPGEAGRYELSYRVVSADGHPVSATLSFTVTSGRQVVPVADRPDDDRGGSTAVVAVVVGLAAVAALALLALVVRRRPGDGDGDGPDLHG